MHFPKLNMPHTTKGNLGGAVANPDGLEANPDFHKELYGAIHQNLRKASETNPETLERLEHIGKKLEDASKPEEQKIEERRQELEEKRKSLL